MGTEADSEITLMEVGLSLTGAVGGAVGSSTCVDVGVSLRRCDSAWGGKGGRGGGGVYMVGRGRGMGRGELVLGACCFHSGVIGDEGN